MLNNERATYLIKLSDTGSKLKWIYNSIVLLLNLIRILPHLILFSLYKRRRYMILSDTTTVKNMILLLIFDKHYRNLFYYRVGNVKYFFKWILQEDKSFHIPVKLEMGKCARIVHSQSTFLNAKSIGDYFVCYHNVTIGTASLYRNNKPEIGNNVTIYTGAVVVGEITIGDNVNIGANSVIVKNVPSDCTVIGSPARIIKLKGKQVDILL